MIAGVALLAAGVVALVGGVGELLRVRARRRAIRGARIVFPADEPGSIATGVYLILSGVAILIVAIIYWPVA